MDTFTAILLLILSVAILIFVLVKRADKITSPEKYRKKIQKIKIELDENGNVMCPYCGSIQIQIVKRGYHWFFGLLGSDQNERVCVHCMKKF